MVTPAPAGRRILVVDDNVNIATLLRQELMAEGYEVATACDGLEALALVAALPPDLILLDIDLPGLSGSEICRRLKSDPATRLIPIVMITGQSALQNRLDAWEYGADDFLPKPFHLVEVTTRCRSLLRIKRLVEERDSAEAVVFALARAVEAKSPYTHGHSERVTRYALDLAGAVGLAAEQREVLRKGGLLHDIGKIRTPDAILDKPGRLTPAEYAVVKGHAAHGAHIVEPLHSVRDAVPLIRWHHERLDGQGYPDGLRGEQIPLLVRLLSVADVYDSVTSDRPYRAALPHEEALGLLRDSARNGGLDPDLVARFAEVVTPAGPARVTDPAPFRGPYVSLPAYRGADVGPPLVEGVGNP
jgi:putative two-component system response regulator